MEKIFTNHDYVCGHDGITYNYKLADNAKQVCQHYFRDHSLFIPSSKKKSVEILCIALSLIISQCPCKKNKPCKKTNKKYWPDGNKS